MGIERIAENLAGVKERIAAACARVGRSVDEVTLIAVTKTVGNAEVAELARLGVRDFGENRIQNGLAKVEAFAAEGFNWHLIGHLQRNKAGAALAGFRIIHSVEAEGLLQVLQKEAEKREIPEVQVLLEVSISGEENKYGLAPQDVAALLKLAAELPRLKVCGLMTMAPLTARPEETRPVFRGLRQLRDRLQEACGIALPQLSMGMSGDFEVAIEEGATHVRVGTALFA